MVIRLGIIGLSASPSAWATMAHIGPLSKEPLSSQYKLTAVATSSSESAKAAAKAHGLPEDKAYDSPEAIAQDKDVDMIVTSVKVPMHHQLTMPALRAGKDAFVEWPLGANLAEAEEMAALAKEKGLKTIIGLQARANPVVQKAKEIIDSGSIGRIVATTLVASSSILTNVTEKYRFMNEPGSGVSVLSIPVLHTLDPLCYLLGEFSHLSASLSTNFPTVAFTSADGSLSDPEPRTFHDAINIQGQLKGKDDQQQGPSISFAYHATTKATPDHLEWIICGENGTLKLEGDHATLQMAETRLWRYEEGEQRVDGLYDKKTLGEWKRVETEEAIAWGGVGEVYKAFVEGDERGVLVDFEGAVERQRLVERILESGESGKRVVF